MIRRHTKPFKYWCNGVLAIILHPIKVPIEVALLIKEANSMLDEDDV